ncbi:MAG: methylated-DNA--[protein]-cysteine S-methyltransferase [Gammaproteobacteria bacterium]|nr:methylated-DNA--[protein]-cysteine S-methyltransferase [Gammaproteobacteria bacterium]
MATASRIADAPAGWLFDADGGRDYRRIAAAIRFLVDRRGRQPDLAEVAAHVGLGPHHFQRLFVRWAGVSPKQFLGYLTVSHARQLLRDSATVLDAALASGLSGPSRLHDLFVGVEGMTPGECRRLGAGLMLRHAVLETALGPALALVTERGVAGLRFLCDEDADGTAALAAARREWPEGRLVSDRVAVHAMLGRLGTATAPALLLRGSRFRLRVWEALLALPEGTACSYGTLAARLGSGASARAVGSAVGDNPVAVLVPCHRVLRGDGGIGGYRWGETRKRALLAREAARLSRGRR